jgi:hypothetical protein
MRGELHVISIFRFELMARYSLDSDSRTEKLKAFFVVAFGESQSGLACVPRSLQVQEATWLLLYLEHLEYHPYQSSVSS